ncbi:MAG: hypothetical protein ACKPKO_17645, partial [Candidatus Fonsibacter sp.]
MGWHRCTLCRSSSTARTAIIDPDSEDLSVFIQPQNTAAAAAEINTSDDDYIPRHIIVNNLIQLHQNKMDEHNKAIMELITQ